jgi:hypothetical protein
MRGRRLLPNFLCVLALVCSAGCYLPDLSDPGGTQRTRRTLRYMEEERRQLEENWHRQDRLKLERERLELERQRVQGW